MDLGVQRPLGRHSLPLRHVGLDRGLRLVLGARNRLGAGVGDVELQRQLRRLGPFAAHRRSRQFRLFRKSRRRQPDAVRLRTHEPLRRQERHHRALAAAAERADFPADPACDRICGVGRHRPESGPSDGSRRACGRQQDRDEEHRGRRNGATRSVVGRNRGLGRRRPRARGEGRRRRPPAGRFPFPRAFARGDTGQGTRRSAVPQTRTIQRPMRMPAPTPAPAPAAGGSARGAPGAASSNRGESAAPARREAHAELREGKTGRQGQEA